MSSDLPDQNDKTLLNEDISVHIFTVSSAMVGVCLTVIGIIRIVITIGKVDTLADDLLAGDALLFLASCLSSYFALRTRNVERMHRVERFADYVFIAALVVMVAVCMVITYSISSG
jgi:esterase/lipase superfamily enzyme